MAIFKLHIYFQITLNQFGFFLIILNISKYNFLDPLFHANVQKFEIILKYVSRI